jgi:hypothetical protein
MHSSHAHSLSDPAKKSGNRGLFVAGVLTLSGIVLVSLIFILKSHSREAKPVNVPSQESAAELVSATGMVFVSKPGRNDWQQVTVGARLLEGDLVQTDSSGEAAIRYSDGVTVSIQASTIFTVQNAGDGSMEISLPSQETTAPSGASTAGQEPSAPDIAQFDKNSEAPVLNDARANQASLFIKLDRIVPFGRSLELIGSVEAGSRLVVNDEIVDVAGDGSFKHFTNPFPVSAQKVRLVMRVTDLAGRIRIVTTTHDFNPHGGND